MNIGFAGTPEFASTALQALLDAGHHICVVLTQPDRPAGRGMKLQASPVKQLAVKHGIEVLQPHGLRLDGKYAQEAQATRQRLTQIMPDVFIVAAYGLILPAWVLQLPRYGCLNIHASLLPRWRGAAPIHRAIEAGDTATGIAIMQMDEGLDTGDILMMQSTPIGAQETTRQLHDRLAALGGKMIVKTIGQLLAEGSLQASPQPTEGITYAHKISKAESWLDWRESADAVLRKIRAFDPFPVAQTLWQAAPLKIWQAETAGPPPVGAHPGEVIKVDASGITVACGGQTAVRLTQLQKAGGKRMPIDQWLNGNNVPAGSVFGLPEIASEAQHACTAQQAK